MLTFGACDFRKKTIGSNAQKWNKPERAIADTSSVVSKV